METATDPASVALNHAQNPIEAYLAAGATQPAEYCPHSRRCGHHATGVLIAKQSAVAGIGDEKRQAGHGHRAGTGRWRSLPPGGAYHWDRSCR